MVFKKFEPPFNIKRIFFFLISMSMIKKKIDSSIINSMI